MVILSKVCKKILEKSARSLYSIVPNRRAVRNKRAGGKILKKHVGQNRRTGGKLSGKSIIAA